MEIFALWIFLTEILPASTRQSSILWRVDNTAALAHVRKEGASREGISSRRPRGSFLSSIIMPAFIPSEENLQADAASRFQLVPDWHLDPRRRFRPCGVHPRSTSASLQLAQMMRFMSWRAADSPEAIDALSMRWYFALAYLFPPIPLLKRVMRKLELSKGVFLLVTPYWEAQTWFASLQALQVLDVRRLPFQNDLVIDLSTGEPPPSLERLFLVVWKICGGLGELMPFRTGPFGLSRQDGSNQKITTKGPGGPSKPSCTLPPFLSIKRL
jgi:hypothetical protein